jgi:hypothetical protein
MLYTMGHPKLENWPAFCLKVGAEEADKQMALATKGVRMMKGGGRLLGRFIISSINERLSVQVAMFSVLNSRESGLTGVHNG